ncbi:MAG: undecaprenyl-phosphate glucose phosphotransferase [Alphaproteobacteria bacterium]
MSGSVSGLSGYASGTDALTIMAGVLRACDATAVLAAGLLAFWLRHEALDLPNPYLFALAAGFILTLNIFHLAGLYRPEAVRHAGTSIGVMTLALLGVIGMLVMVAYFTKTSDHFSRVWAILWACLSYAFLLSIRFAVEVQLVQWRKDGRLNANVAIIGGGNAALRLIARMSDPKQPGYRVVGVFDDQPGALDALPAGVARGSLDELIRLSRALRIDDVIIALPAPSDEALLGMLKKVRSLTANVHLGPDGMALPRVPSRGFRTLAGLPVLNLHERPLSGWGIVLKAIEDRLLAALILGAVSPLLLLIALGIILSSGRPVLFRQIRYGFNNNEILVYKFRTMHADEGSDPSVPQARRNDPRVTTFGAFLRRTSLDELPQLWNVLKGDMSLVGPRPHAVAHNVQYAEIIDDYLGRHRLKPGITGWAQVNGLRGEVDTPEKMRLRVEHDLYYIDHWSLLFDMRILLLTVLYGFVHKNAY